MEISVAHVIDINSTNWKFAKAWAPSAFSIIATQFNDLFQPIQALQVCSKLMISCVVKCMIEDERISEKSIQMYCDVHRLLLEIATEFPEIRKNAEQKLRDFIKSPANRSRAKTPDLGDLVMCLAVADSVSWKEIAEIYVQEAFRRNVIRIDSNQTPRFWTFHFHSNCITK